MHQAASNPHETINFLFYCAVFFLAIIVIQSLWKWYKERVRLHRAMAEFKQTNKQVRTSLTSAGCDLTAYDLAINNFLTSARNIEVIKAGQDVLSSFGQALAAAGLVEEKKLIGLQKENDVH